MNLQELFIGRSSDGIHEDSRLAPGRTRHGRRHEESHQILESHGVTLGEVP
jgi:hypothetical protein